MFAPVLEEYRPNETVSCSLKSKVVVRVRISVSVRLFVTEAIPLSE